MTDHDLKAIEARATAATRGPWTTGVRWEDPYDTYWVPINAPSTSEDEPHQPDRVALIRYHAGAFQFPHADAKADAEFIAAAREDVPRLLAEVRRLRGQVITDEQVRAGADALVRLRTQAPSLAELDADEQECWLADARAVLVAATGPAQPATA